STLIFPGPSYLPQPCTHSTLFFLKRNSMPLACFLTILSLRARTLPQLIFSPLTSKPSSAAFLKRSYTTAWCSSTLVRMQPPCRQGPPRNGSFSTTTVFNPSSPARMAATYPPGPLPIIATSYFATRNLPSGEPQQRSQLPEAWPIEKRRSALARQ